MRAALEKLLAGGRDDALLRFSLGVACLKEGDAEHAALHFGRALEHNPDYSAAWKLRGQALLNAGRPAAAADTWTRGIEIAAAQGDVQAAKEMRVFLKRLQKQGGGAR
jgi:Tfp pilus assembly protein PilF